MTIILKLQGITLNLYKANSIVLLFVSFLRIPDLRVNTFVNHLTQWHIYYIYIYTQLKEVYSQVNGHKVEVAAS